MRRAAALAAAVAAAAMIAACGSSASGGPIALAPSGGRTAPVSTSAAPASTNSTTSTVTTPKPPSPLSKEPVIHSPGGTPPSRLVVHNLINGTGKSAAPGDTITVNYVGALYKNGKVFDSSWKRHQTFTTPLSTSSVIAGWVKGIAGMRVGGRRELIIPPSLAYGKSANGSIPPNSTLIFVIDLLAVHSG
jgi:peptidylprolyl isomerase